MKKTGFWLNRWIRVVSQPFRWLISRFLERHDRIHEKRIRREIEVTLTHELKTPLTTILGYSEILMENGDQLGEDNRKYIAGIHRQSRELVRFIDNLIVLSVMDFNPQVFFRNEADIVSIAMESMADFDRERKGETGYSIEIEGESSVISVCNERLLRKSLTELFLNAWLYRAPERPLRIRVGVSKEKQMGVITVSDNGTGIPPRYLHRIWEKFFRVEPEDHAKVPGLGVGLCLVRQAAELFDGSVTVDSREGLGTTFIIHLPLAGNGESSNRGDSSNRGESAIRGDSSIRTVPGNRANS